MYSKCSPRYGRSSQKRLPVCVTEWKWCLMPRRCGGCAKGKIQPGGVGISTNCYMLEPKPGDDPVLDAYENLTKICTFIETKEELITKAKTRKILGNPPISPDRHSVCDELLWEELLEFCDEDLI